jgi:HEAT repeat protein
MTSGADVSRWIGELKNANWVRSRVKAADRLGEMGDVMAVGPLIESLKDESFLVRESAAIALVKIGDLQGVKAVLTQGTDKVVMTAAKVLAGLDPLQYKAEPIDRAAMADLKQPNAVEVLWQSGRGGFTRVLQTVKDLEETVAAEVVESLIQALRTRSVGVRAMVALALGGVKGDSRVVGALREALGDDERASIETTDVGIPLLGYPQFGYCVAEVAGLSLVRLRDEESMKRIVQLALGKWYDLGEGNPKEDFVRFMFMLGWESVTAELALMREHEDRSVRVRAVSCLAAMKDARVVEPLIGFLDDEVSIRKTAVHALGMIGDSSALEALTRVTQDKKWAVRRAAKSAIKRIEARSS